jgi:hypothetical protein
MAVDIEHRQARARRDVEDLPSFGHGRATTDQGGRVEAELGGAEAEL